MTRQFKHSEAKREAVPVWISLIGPSGSGKTYSALRLARGMSTILGGSIWILDTEARRALHYADAFRFVHVPFGEPFGSLDYLAAVRHGVANGARTVIIDSMSHEHEGPGGYLQTHEAELNRMAGDDFQKRERVKMVAWKKPTSLRSQMVQSLLQLEVNLIFCFRAKERIRIVRKGEKMAIEDQGWSTIGGESLVYEMTASCFLPPASRGVPMWTSEMPGERAAMKLPRQFEGIFNAKQELTEDIGKALGEWAKGSSPISEAYRLLDGAARHGMKALEAAWKRTSADDRQDLEEHLAGFKRQARDADSSKDAAKPAEVR